MDKLHVSKDASRKVIDYFKRFFDVQTFEGLGTYDAVINHPDMFMFYDNELFHDPRLPLGGHKLEAIGQEYPDNVKYNCVKLGQTVILNEKTISESLLRYFKASDYKIISVKQGYTKCSVAVIDDQSMITSDVGIYKCCKDHLSVLLISAGHIVLESLEYGFIGGCTLRHHDRVFFSGDITSHPDYELIRDFIESRDLIIDYVDEPLRDLGSFIIESVN
jgi:hypothetical protein